MSGTSLVTGPAGTFTVSNRWDGGKTAKLDVPEGSTTWTVTVTSEDGNEARSYTMTVNRAAPSTARPPVAECYGEGFSSVPGGSTEHSALDTLTVTPFGGGTLVSGPGALSHSKRSYTVQVTNDEREPEDRIGLKLAVRW